MNFRKFCSVFLLCTALIQLLSLRAFAVERNIPGGGSYCLTASSSSSEYSSEQKFFEGNYDNFYYQNFNSNLYRKAGFGSFSCIEKQGWLDALDVIAISIGVVTTASYTCAMISGGATLPVTVAAGTAGVVLSFTNLILKNIPCDDTRGARKIEDAVKTSICKIAGIENGNCDLKNINIEYKEDLPYTPIREI